MDDARRCIPLLLAAALGLAPAPAQPQGGIELEVELGQVTPVCGLMRCPAGAGACDDPKVAIPEFTPRGMGFRGLTLGSTTCSARTDSGGGAMVIFRVKVVPPRPAAPPSGQGAGAGTGPSRGSR